MPKRHHPYFERAKQRRLAFLAKTAEGQMWPSVSRLESTAIHEAGHAVASVLLGWDFDYVTVMRQGTSLGHVATNRDKLQHDLRYIDNETFLVEAGIVYSAGYHAVNLITHQDALSGCSGDVLALKNMVKIIYTDLEEANVALRRYWQQGEVFLDRHQYLAAIRWVAAQLLVKPSLTFLEVREIVIKICGTLPMPSAEHARLLSAPKPTSSVKATLRRAIACLFIVAYVALGLTMHFAYKK